MLLFTLIQHVELQENSPSILESTRSFRTNWLGKFLYMNMNNHVEHHLYPNVPFHALPDLAEAIKDQVPAPDPGFFRSNWEVMMVSIRRSCGLPTKAPSIRQAPHMISEGGRFKKFAKRSM
jgi:fatty acid desaturase